MNRQEALDVALNNLTYVLMNDTEYMEADHIKELEEAQEVLNAPDTADKTCVLLVGHESDAEPILDLAVFGPFKDVAEAQEYARAFREARAIPGHANAVPTPEENEAWTDAGWTFGIRQPNRRVADAELVRGR